MDVDEMFAETHCSVCNAELLSNGLCRYETMANDEDKTKARTLHESNQHVYWSRCVVEHLIHNNEY